MTLVAANVTLPTPPGANVVVVETTEELRGAVRTAAMDADVVVMAAAVADFRPATTSESKIKKLHDGSVPVLELVETPDILAELASSRLRAGQIVVGFAAETGDATASVLEHGRAKALRKRADLLVVNAVGAERGFGTADNDVTILDVRGEVVARAAGSKAAVAHAVWDAVAGLR